MPLSGLSNIMSAAMRGARADFALLAILVDHGRLLVHSGIGPIAEDLVGNLIAIDESRVSSVVRSGDPLLIADYARTGTTVAPEVRQEIGSIMVVPLRDGSTVDGVMSIGRLVGNPPFGPAELADVAAFVDRAETSREIDSAREERRAARLVEDRTRIAADLHDHVIQELFAAGMTLQAVALTITDEAARERILDQVGALDATVARIRTMISELPRGGGESTMPLTKRIIAIVDSLTPALKAPPTVSIVGPVESSVSPDLAYDLEAVLREALSNIARHADASEVRVRAAVTDGQLNLDVVDNGRGIGTPTRSSGLANMRFRAESHQGAFTYSEPPSGGTHLHWTASLGESSE